jgi:hypothetical protein
MRITYPRTHLLIATTLLLMSGNLAIAGSSDAHPAKSWLDNAVSGKECPSTPVNVPAGGSQFSTSALLNRITISGDKLSIKGTDDPDHIVVSSGGSSSLVDVAWNGRHLGRFGPVKAIELRGHGGDDVLIVKSDVSLPVLIDGGSGDDCVQGGSGADQLLGGAGDDVLIAGAGRPALDGGSGNDRVVIPQAMGTLRYAPAANSGILRLLGKIYDLQPLNKSGSSSKGTPSPIVLGSADMGDQQVLSELQAVRAAGQSVVVTDATAAQSEQLRLQLGHPNSANALSGSNSGSTADATQAVTYFRTAQRPGTKAYDYSTGKFNNLSSPLDDWTTQWLSQVFSATAIVPQAPNDSPSNDLQTLANSYTSKNAVEDGQGDLAQIANSVWGVRSFQNNTDFYYVLQEVDYRSPGIFPISNTIGSSLSSPVVSPGPGLIQTTPASTYCSQSTTSGVTWNIGGSTGYNEQQGFNGALTGGVSVSNSKTITCPNFQIVNVSNPVTGDLEWFYQGLPSGLVSFYNQWIWEVPFSAYGSRQDTMVFPSKTNNDWIVGHLNVALNSSVPAPFGKVQSLQNPAVTKVSPNCVRPGDTFVITGTNLYPSLVSSVLIGGTALSSSEFTPATHKNIDTKITVVAPKQLGNDQPVVVQTGVNISNSNISIDIQNSCSP